MIEISSNLIHLLDQFNRKERFFLVGNALGKEDFGLSPGFRKRLQYALGLEEAIPPDAFAAMDYHLDWIAAALTAFAKGDTKQAFANDEVDDTKLVMGNQEDVDFLVCFKDEESIYNLILLEAKGYGAWDSKQMKSKMTRLRRIFGDKGDRIAGVKPIFCLTSPRPPKQLKYGEWPEWCKPTVNEGPYWLELPIPVNRRLVGRCDAEGNSAEHGQYFHIYAG